MLAQKSRRAEASTDRRRGSPADTRCRPPTNAVPPPTTLCRPPTNPWPGHRANGRPRQESPARPAAAQVLTQEAVAEALGADVPPRDAAERVTFATWAIVTGKSPGGIFNALPKLDDATADKMAQRLSERAEGTITVEDVKFAPDDRGAGHHRARVPRGR